MERDRVLESALTDQRAADVIADEHILRLGNHAAQNVLDEIVRALRQGDEVLAKRQHQLLCMIQRKQAS